MQTARWFRINRQSGTGCCFFVDPREGAKARIPQWYSAFNCPLKGILSLTDKDLSGDYIDVSRLAAKVQWAATGSGMQYLMLWSGEASVCLELSGVPATLGPFSLTLMVAPRDKTRVFDRQVAQFQSLLQVKKQGVNEGAGCTNTGKGQVVLSSLIASDEVLPPRSNRHLFHRDTLFIHDRKALGLSNRQAAEALYGAERVAEEWPDRGGSLRARVRRLVKAGQHMVAGGYKSILQE